MIRENEQNIVRCDWARGTDNMVRYHDTEWGVPHFGDHDQFEFLILESAQAGLSWSTILNRRDGYRECFAGFDPVQVASFSQKDVERLVTDSRIIRNRKKIESTIVNAGLFLDIVERYGSFAGWLLRYLDGKPVCNHWQTLAEVPASTPVSEKIAADLRKLGFRFLGPTIVYAHMQATGLVNDHLVSCFRHQEAERLMSCIC